MNRSAREGESVKRFERSNGPDIALYKNYLYLFYLYPVSFLCLCLPNLTVLIDVYFFITLCIS